MEYSHLKPVFRFAKDITKSRHYIRLRRNKTGKSNQIGFHIRDNAPDAEKL
jgi:hypothetical protein